MNNRILVFYGSYRSDRMGIRLANFVVERLRRRGDDVELIDARAINLPMLDRMYKEYPKGQAPEALERLAGKIRGADGFVFVTGEYNWGVQPGLKNLTDHFLEEWFWRPAAIVSYSAGRLSGARAATAWHGTLSEMGMVVVSSTIAVGPIGQTLSAEGEPVGESGQAVEGAFPRFADDLKRGDNGPVVSERMARWCAERTTQEAVDTLGQAMIPAGPVLSPQQALEHPHIRASGFMQDVDYPGLPKPAPLMRAAVRLSETPGEIVSRPPTLGEHTDLVLADIGYDAAAIAALRRDGIV